MTFQPRHLDWPALLNARDLGGMPTLDGGAIRDRALVRTDNTHKLTDDGVEAVRSYGVGRVIDLRREVECEHKPSPFASTPAYVNLPVQNPADPDNETLELAAIYCTMLDARPKLFAEAVAAVAEAPEGAVVVHCAGGKDRTGIVVAMALTLAGVARDVIAADYALTEGRLAEESAAVLQRITDPDVRANVERLQPTPASNMLETLAHLDTAYGGVESYLLAAGGLTSAQVTAVRDRLRA